MEDSKNRVPLRSKEGRTFILVVILLSLVLFAGAIWAINNFTQRDKQNLTQLQSDFERLEKAYNTEISNIDAEIFPYPKPDSIREVLMVGRNDLRAQRELILNQPNEAIQNIDALQAKKLNYTKQLSEIYTFKDEFAIKEISDLKKELENFRRQALELEKKNKSLSAQLGSMIKKFKGSETELNKLKAEKERLDKLLASQQITREQLDSLVSERNSLKELLQRSEDLIAEQQRELERLKGLTRRIYNFTAQYDFQKRRVVLDETGKHLGKVGKEIHIEFETGEGVFENPNEPRLIYLSLYRNGKPYKITKKEIPVLPQGKTGATIYIDKNLESGDYYFDITYKEESIMQPYKFKVR
ncbi:hypothetical protein [Hugenholtzia roseola]|uniref:hypothetical protein n=1 Tax=Hugenholtzia roseola TaxID=1002 RepID=UPI000426C8D0|nr:hypothetical protein [Hugenholtzia roseola]